MPLGQGQGADVLGAVYRLDPIAEIGLLVEEVGVDEEGGSCKHRDGIDDDRDSLLVFAIISYPFKKL